MKVLYPPSKTLILEKPSIFLAGSIEMGKAIDWQSEVIHSTNHLLGTILNPRRKDWDSSWEQDISNPMFKEQVEWELDGLDRASIVFFYFQPGTMSPITMMELGYVVGFKDPAQKILVVCPKGFWRKGNVDIMCHRDGIPVSDTLEEGIGKLCKLARS